MANIRNQQLKVFNTFTAGEENVVDRHLIHDTGFVDVTNVDTEESVIKPIRTNKPYEGNTSHLSGMVLKENIGGEDRIVEFARPVNYVIYGNELYYVARDGSSYKRVYLDKKTNQPVKGSVFSSMDGLKVERTSSIQMGDPYKDLHKAITDFIPFENFNSLPAESPYKAFLWGGTHEYIELGRIANELSNKTLNVNGDIEAQYEEINTYKTQIRELSQTIKRDMGGTNELKTAILSSDFKTASLWDIPAGDSMVSHVCYSGQTSLKYIYENGTHPDRQQAEHIWHIVVSMVKEKARWDTLLDFWANKHFLNYLPLVMYTRHQHPLSADMYDVPTERGTHFIEDMRKRIDKFRTKHIGSMAGDTPSVIANINHDIVAEFTDATRQSSITPIGLYEFSQWFAATNGVLWCTFEKSAFNNTYGARMFDRRHDDIFDNPIDFTPIPQWNAVLTPLKDDLTKVIDATDKVEDKTDLLGKHHIYSLLMQDNQSHTKGFMEVPGSIYDGDNTGLKIDVNVMEEPKTELNFLLLRKEVGKNDRRQVAKFTGSMQDLSDRTFTFNLNHIDDSKNEVWYNEIKTVTAQASLASDFNLIAEYGGSIFLGKVGSQSLYFSKTGKPEDIPALNELKTSQPIRAMQTAGAGLFIWTTDDALYLLTGRENNGKGNNTLAIKRVGSGVTIKSAGAVCSHDNLVVWMSNGSIHNTSGYGSADATRAVWTPPKGKVLQTLYHHGKVYFLMEDSTLILYDTKFKYILKTKPPKGFIYESLSTFEGRLFAVMSDNTTTKQFVELFKGDNFLDYDFTLKTFSGYSHDTRLRFNNIVISHDDVPHRYKGVDTKAIRTEVELYIDDYLVAQQTLSGRDATRIHFPARNNVGQGMYIRCKGSLKLRSFRLRYNTIDYED